MAFVRNGSWLVLFFSLSLGCGGMGDDLAPSGDDRRPTVEAGTTGPAVGQLAPDFTLQDSLGNPAPLADERIAGRTVVLYFTMWCPICDGHMSHLRRHVVPAFPEVTFWVVDYVSGSVAGARGEEVANGYAGAGFTVLADTDTHVLEAYDATMGTTVVIDAEGVIQMNEDYKDGSRLQDALERLL